MIIDIHKTTLKQVNDSAYRAMQLVIILNILATSKLPLEDIVIFNACDTIQIHAKVTGDMLEAYHSITERVGYHFDKSFWDNFQLHLFAGDK